MQSTMRNSPGRVHTDVSEWGSVCVRRWGGCMSGGMGRGRPVGGGRWGNEEGWEMGE